MSTPDLNLLFALDVLLAEGSVATAARRLRLSPSAMSRTLARLRETTGDPLLVRAGRGLVATPRAIALQPQVSQIVKEAAALLAPLEGLDIATLARTFTLRTSDGFVECFGPGLIAKVSAEAPNVRLNFLQKPDKDSGPLREGRVDLETGVVDASLGPELRTQALFLDRLIGVVRAGHPLANGEVTAKQYAAARHVIVSRSGFEADAVDRPFLPEDLTRQVASVVGGFAVALSLARTSDLVATVPERHSEILREGMFSFPIPADTKPFTVAMLWHPRLDADAAHRWLRGCVREVCLSTAGSSGPA
ncbi:DNA-binding transcriptional LysR family regulator [Phenylobacterium haematophilum]|uniref:DNA-binding transcriptional LysR family regulator n=1 Tax=Phenylobacterium haematophilum TaxID=98513 RepID=A0A839ZWI3_9CAUL|nr:LysR family transcriptional regulator [Phenylobacterium haematophilum]MBB3889731.1 DNA-binding transcriptional LysR family regulator [Phenylobacterium haematophilum]